MNDKTTEIAARLRAEADDPATVSVAITASEMRMLIEHVEALKRENEELRRQSARGTEMLDAASVFLKAYGDKYRNFAGGGIRPTAILHREVRVMWSIFKDIRGLTEREL